MTDYEQLVGRLAAQQSSELISNSSAEHAAVLIKYMFTCAEKTIKIFNGCLSTSVFGKADVINAAKTFVEKGGRIQVVVQEAFSEEALASHGLLTALRQMCCNNNETKNSFTMYLGDEQVQNIPSHFLIMDNAGYRLEENREQPVAFASFNDPQIVESLDKLFERILNKSTPIPCV